MAQYLPIFAMLVLALIFAGISRVVSQLLAPRLPSVPKSAPYECGIVPSNEPPERFPVKFFLAVVFRELGGFGIGAIVIFSAAVFESFVYLISKGALDWGPVKRMQRSDIVSPARTTTSTIRRVGLEGRQPVTADEAA